MVAKEATEDTLAAIRNNKNIITGEEGKKLAESIPEDRREYDIYVYERDLNIPFLGKFAMHSFIVSDPKEQNRIYTDEALKNPNIIGEGALRDEFKNIGMPESKLINGRRIFSIGGFSGEKEKGEPEGKLVPRENYEDDFEVYKKDKGISSNTKLTGEIVKVIDLPPEEETEFIKRMVKAHNNYKNNENYPNYSIHPKVIVKYQKGIFIVPPIGFNCNSWSSGLMKNSGETDNPLNNSKSMRIDWGKDFQVPDKYFKGGKE